ncbi:hypothetical protein, partial [Bradyrhizobium sp. AS23.2]
MGTMIIPHFQIGYFLLASLAFLLVKLDTVAHHRSWAFANSSGGLQTEASSSNDQEFDTNK